MQQSLHLHSTAFELSTLLSHSTFNGLLSNANLWEISCSNNALIFVK